MTRLRWNGPRAPERILCGIRLVVILSLSLPVWPGLAQPVRAPEAPIRSHPVGVEDGLSHPDVHTHPQPLFFEHLSREEGLSFSEVWAILQDRQGFMWIGTADGLNKYDGYTVTVYKHDPDEVNSLSENRIYTLLQDRQGSLWIGTPYKGLNRFDPATETFTRYQHDPNDPESLGSHGVRSLLEDRNGTLWVGLNWGGLDAFDPTTETFTHFKYDPNDPNSLSHDQVLDLAQDTAGSIWVGTFDGGLNRFDPATGTFTRYQHDPDDPHSLSNNRIWDIEIADGQIWLATAGGLNRFDPATGTFTRYQHDPDDPHSLSENTANVLLAQDGHLWVGFAGGQLDRFDPTTGRAAHYMHDPRDPHSLTKGNIRSLYRDAFGMIWVGTFDGGVDRFSPDINPFEHFEPAPDQSHLFGTNTVWALYEDPDQTLWIGTEKSLIRRSSRQGRRTRFIHDPARPNSLPSPDVTALVRDREGILWVGTYGGGLGRFDDATQTFTRYQHDPADPHSLGSQNVKIILEDREGMLWIGTWFQGLDRFDRSTGTFTHFRFDPDDPKSLRNDMIQSLYEDRRGLLWVGTSQGLHQLDRATGAFIRYEHDPLQPHSLSDNTVEAIGEDQTGTLWIGTNRGLNRFDRMTGRFTAFTEQNSDLPSDRIQSLLVDDAGRVWISSNNGIAAFDPATARFEPYDLSDGLKDLEFLPAAAFKGPRGKLFFGGKNGVTSFFPEQVTTTGNPYPPRVWLTDVRVDGTAFEPGTDHPLQQHIAFTEAVQLAPHQRDVEIDFVALHYSRPAQNQYTFRLDPYDETWRPAGAQRTATYTNLDPGTYVFRVRGANASGVWNEEGAVLTLTVAPFFYETWWFLALCGLAAAGLLAAAYGYRIRQLRRTEQALEAQVAERTRALRAEKQKTEAQAERLREMDRLKSRFFTNVSHEFRTPLTLTIGPLEDLQADEGLPAVAQQQIDLALRNSRRLLRLINQLLDIARLEAGEMRLKTRKQDLAAFLRGLTLSFAPLAERRRIRFDVQVPDTPMPVYFDADKLEQVFVNLLSNAFKFTPEGGAILVRLAIRRGENTNHGQAPLLRDCVAIEVRDNGPGIPPEDLPHLFERFYQVDEAHTSLLAGSGIGLSVAKDLAELHQGMISVESTLGFGATFTVMLPLGRAHLRDAEIDEIPDVSPDRQRTVSVLLPGNGQATTEPTPARDEMEPEDDRTTVLVIDDNADIRAYVRSHLDAHYRVLEAADGVRGLERARAALPDLIISDVMMPALDGFGLVRSLKADRETDFIPVILLTAKATGEDRIEGLEEGADAYLTKPFSIRVLQARIDNLIASRRKLKERFAAAPPAPPAPVVPEGERSASDALFLERVRTTVEAHLSDENFTVEDLAAAVEQSRSNLHRRLRELLDQTPTTFIRSVRLEHAGALLVEQRGTVSEVAYGVGFKSISHFSQSFRKHYGVSPSAYLDQRSTPPPAYSG